MPPADAPRRLRRSTSDRMVGGVAGGLGRYFDLDPVLFRIAFVVLVFAGGAGILAYLGLWLITPSDGEGEVPGNAGVRALAVIGGIVLVCVSLPFLLAGAVIAIPLLPLTLLVLVIILLARGAQGKADSDTSDVLARVALVLLVITVSIGAFFAAAAGAALGGGAVIAGVVIALGLALIAAAFMGGRRARWLVLPAIAIAAPLGFVAASELDIKGGMGERSYRPTSVSELQPRYKLGAGEMRIDLRDLQLPDGRTPLNVKMGAGHVVVYVPENVCVSSRVKLGAGYAEVLDRDSSGFDVELAERAHPAVRRAGARPQRRRRRRGRGGPLQRRAPSRALRSLPRAGSLRSRRMRAGVMRRPVDVGRAGLRPRRHVRRRRAAAGLPRRARSGLRRPGADDARVRRRDPARARPDQPSPAAVRTWTA